MTAPDISRQAIVSQILDLKGRERDRRGRRVVAIRARPEWADDAEFEADGEHIHVVPGLSPLGVRAALAERDALDVWLVILTELGEAELGVEVVARLARRRLEFVDSWDAAARSFGLTAVDPLLRPKPQLANLLLRCRPARGYPRVPSTVLMRDHALGTVCEYALHLSGLPGRGGPALLEWLASAGSGQYWKDLPEQVQEELAFWWSSVAGVAGSIAPAFLAAGAERDAIAFGLAADAVALSGNQVAAGFLAAKIGGGIAVDQFVAYGAEARHASDPSGYSAQRAEALLAEANATSAAVYSDILPAGLEQRLSAVGDELRAATSDASVAVEVREALARCRAHRDSAAAELRIEAAENALRLVLFMHTGAGAVPESLDAAAQAYRAAGAWVDRARTTMRRGESNASLVAAYASIDEAVGARREAENHRFADLAANWFKSGGSLKSLVPVEQLLADVVAPLAPGGVLLIVLDGGTLAIWSELAEGLEAAGWSEVAPRAVQTVIGTVGLATSPSVTKFSRTSLLCGGLQVGTKKDEAERFPAALKAVSKGHPARLFHKAEMSASQGMAISHEASVTIADPKIPVVGVVINEIDDALGGGSQSRRTWTIASIPPLQACLNAARAANRAVVITSDHGHVVDYDVRHSGVSKGGERWRPGNAMPLTGEIGIEGPRVLAPGHAAVVPWTEKVRYSTGANAGYHGGLTPQEMLTPLSLLLPIGAARAGLEARASTAPAWW